jgi:hypothetical protein
LDQGQAVISCQCQLSVVSKGGANLWQESVVPEQVISLDPASPNGSSQRMVNECDDEDQHDYALNPLLPPIGN